MSKVKIRRVNRGKSLFGTYQHTTIILAYYLTYLFSKTVIYIPFKENVPSEYYTKFFIIYIASVPHQRPGVACMTRSFPVKIFIFTHCM